MTVPAGGDEIVLAADGGGTKTDLALLRADGTLLGHVRGGPTQVHYLGVERTIEVLGELLDQATRRAGLDPAAHPIAATGHLLLAGIDVPEELTAIQRGMAAVNWSRKLVLGNDTDALLRAGTDRGWGVAVVCGTGINCLGLAPNGRDARFLSFGDLSGDWGGGHDVGVAALAAAVRSVDGRGPDTVLTARLPEHFGTPDVLRLAQAFHLGELPPARIGEICPLVLVWRDEDAVCGAIAQRLIEEVVAFVRAAIARLELGESDPDVVLGGGVLRNADASVIDTIANEIGRFAPAAQVIVSASDPIVGAALLGLDALGADAAARARAREALGALTAPGSAPRRREFVARPD